MKILLTGNQGYIGSVLSNILTSEYDVVGYDIGYFKDCNLYPIKELDKQIVKDIREDSSEDLLDIDIVIHLAALSNDPLGELNDKLTNDINYEATKNLANIAKKSKVKKFIYVSSQSMYGISNTNEELDEINSYKKPFTEYAKTKWKAEQYLNSIKDDQFIVTSFRPSTVFGASPRLRCDIVFNNLMACAYTTKKIEIKSDGSPWRPVIHVKDVAAAIILELLENSNDPLLSAFVPGCKKNGIFSSISVTLESISLAVAPLFARTATVFSEWNKANQRR